MLRALWPRMQQEAAEIVHVRQLFVASREGTQTEPRAVANESLARTCGHVHCPHLKMLAPCRLDLRCHMLLARICGP